MARQEADSIFGKNAAKAREYFELPSTASDAEIKAAAEAAGWTVTSSGRIVRQKLMTPARARAIDRRRREIEDQTELVHQQIAAIRRLAGK